MIRLKRAYESPEPSDGYRVLVDRMWPAGLRKARAALDGWLKDIGPSDALRRSLRRDPSTWGAFLRRYRRELAEAPASEILDELVRRARRGTVTLLYAARDAALNGAIVLRDEIERRLRHGRGARHPKSVRSDVKDVQPTRAGVAFPSDLEALAPARKDRRPAARGSRSDHVPRAVPEATRERRGGRDRPERRRHVALVRSTRRQRTAR